MVKTYQINTYVIQITAENQAKIGESGVIKTIIDATNMNINDVNVCEYGCGALLNITSNNGKKYTDNTFIN